jgi:hypothetical protein
MYRPSMASPSSGASAAFGRFWPYTRGFRRSLAVGALLLVLALAGEVTATWLFGEIPDHVLAKNGGGSGGHGPNGGGAGTVGQITGTVGPPCPRARPGSILSSVSWPSDSRPGRGTAA